MADGTGTQSRRSILFELINVRTNWQRRPFWAPGQYKVVAVEWSTSLTAPANQGPRQLKEFPSMRQVMFYFNSEWAIDRIEVSVPHIVST